jgi:RNA 2',3'-cyclic 3'-phosphodiesterase
MMRAFVAIDLPQAVRSALAVQQFLLPLPRHVEPAQLHLTLCFLGEAVPDPVIEAVHEAILALRLPAFDLAIHGIGHFGGAKPRVVYAGVAPNPALMRLQTKVETLARQAGCDIPHHRFVPHVTLGRFQPSAVDDLPRLERGIVHGAGFTLDPFAVAEVVLYQSHLGPKPRYDALARYPLR